MKCNCRNQYLIHNDNQHKSWTVSQILFLKVDDDTNFRFPPPPSLHPVWLKLILFAHQGASSTQGYWIVAVATIVIITLLSRPARWWNPFKFPLLCSRVPLPQSPNPNFIQLLPQILHRSKTSNMIFAVFAFLSIWRSIYKKCPKKRC